MNSKLRLAALGLVAAGALAGCSGQQVVVRVEDNRDIAGATVVAQETCARRGGQARLVAVVNQNIVGRHSTYEPRPPDAVFACDPIR